MPIRLELRALYRGPEYAARRKRIVVTRANWRCEHCNEEQGQPYQNNRGKWVTVQIGMAHLDQDPRNNDDANLAALCRKCHLAHDRAWHLAASRDTRKTRKDAARPLLAPILTDAQVIANLSTLADVATRHADERGEPYSPQLQDLIAWIAKRKAEARA